MEEPLPPHSHPEPAGSWPLWMEDFLEQTLRSKWTINWSLGENTSEFAWRGVSVECTQKLRHCLEESSRNLANNRILSCCRRGKKQRRGKMRSEAILQAEVKLASS